MARRGRPKKPNVIRFPGGQIKEEEPLPAPFNLEGVAEVEVVHEGKIVQLRQRKPELTRLFEEGRLRQHYRIAGEKYIKLVEDFRRLILAPRSNASVSRPEGRTGGEGTNWDTLSLEEVKAAQDHSEGLTKAYDKVWLLLVEPHCGIAIKHALDDLCLNDNTLSPQRLDMAKEGLKMLAKHWNITEQKSA